MQDKNKLEIKISGGINMARKHFWESIQEKLNGDVKGTQMNGKQMMECVGEKWGDKKEKIDEAVSMIKEMTSIYESDAHAKAFLKALDEATSKICEVMMAEGYDPKDKNLISIIASSKKIDGEVVDEELDEKKEKEGEEEEEEEEKEEVDEAKKDDEEKDTDEKEPDNDEDDKEKVDEDAYKAKVAALTKKVNDKGEKVEEGNEKEDGEEEEKEEEKEEKVEEVKVTKFVAKKGMEEEELEEKKCSCEKDDEEEEVDEGDEFSKIIDMKVLKKLPKEKLEQIKKILSGVKEDSANPDSSIASDRSRMMAAKAKEEELDEKKDEKELDKKLDKIEENIVRRASEMVV